MMWFSLVMIVFAIVLVDVAAKVLNLVKRLDQLLQILIDERMDLKKIREED